MTKSNLEEERVYFIFRFITHHEGKSGQELGLETEAEVMEEC